MLGAAYTTHPTGVTEGAAVAATTGGTFGPHGTATEDALAQSRAENEQLKMQLAQHTTVVRFELQVFTCVAP
eukprot:COSAG01_NODE_8909_length_2618_cov_64.231044_2_plen_72_part_00